MEEIGVFKAERDAVIFLGLLSHIYLHFDPVIEPRSDNPSQPATHSRGLNIHALIVDNVDGAILALEKNQIHATQSPVEHAEQRALRSAIAMLHMKRPKPSGMTVEEYYRSQMFYSDGASEFDFLCRGATLYSSLEPCPMCATTLLVTRIKRSIFVLSDQTYGGIWNAAKKQYYEKYQLSYGQLTLSNAASAMIASANRIYDQVLRDIQPLRTAKIPDTLLLDYIRDDLQAGFLAFRDTTERDLATEGEHRAANARTLKELKVLCNIPT